jgi:hypothetical protein
MKNYNLELLARNSIQNSFTIEIRCVSHGAKPIVCRGSSL